VLAKASEQVPHQFPFRLVERVEPEHDGRLAIVLSTAGGALPGAGPWPITLVAEALAQAILLVVEPAGPGALRLVGLDRVALYQSLEPGDRLEVEVEELGTFGGLRRYLCRGRRGGGLAATAEITVSGP
jgi:3-hydroxymyristoyl/3-hydroxydecanoyl-(acyl carrier protein) dehydratase